MQHLGARLQALGWPKFTLLFFAGVAMVVVFASDTLYGRFYTIIAFSEAVFAPMCGIALADRIALRRNRVDVRALYATSVGSPYHYWGGVNYAAFAAMAAGGGLYLWLFNPLAMVGTPLFTHLSATLPSAATAFVVHVVLARFVAIPAGKGAYDEVRVAR